MSSAFFIHDISNVDVRVAIWRHLLPRVELFYAVKTNPDQAIVDRCAKLATGFDVASPAEMLQVYKCGGNFEKVIYANPVKSPAHIAKALEYGIKKMTFDSVEELEKIKKVMPDAECVLRISTDSSLTTAIYNLNEKYGLPMNKVDDVLRAAKNLDMRIKGVAFHVGSGGVGVKAYASSIINARKIFDRAVELELPEMDFLDLGGGFSMVHPEPENNFNVVGPIISVLLEEHFADPKI